MTWVEAGLDGQLVLALLGVVAAVATRGRTRNVATGTLTAVLGLVGVATGLAELGGAHGSVRLGTALPVDALTLTATPLGGLFQALVGAVGALAAVYAIGYAHGTAASRTQWAAFVVFLLGLQLVPAAGDVVTFLLAWELMAGASTVVVLADQADRPEVRSAGVWYAVLTHLSFAALAAGFAVLASAAGGTAWGTLALAHPRGGTATLAFCLLAAGFATKAGLAPLHVWLPMAHPVAPSHASALMSGAMVTAGLYGLILVTWRLLPDGPTWWALLLVGLGAASALLGILQASVTTALKRLLASSTTENVGLMVAALGLSRLYAHAGLGAAADAALLACLLLAVGHAAFKSTAFLAAGAVQQVTGERDLDRLGGLVGVMPWTAGAFGVAALGAAALPLTGGFVAEWVLLQALLAGGSADDPVVAVSAPLTLGVIALVAGLALLTFVKAYGIGFLARPRSLAALGAHEVAPTMRAAMAVGAAGVLGLGLAPGPVARALGRAVHVGVGRSGTLGLRLDGLGATLDPVALTVLTAALAVPVLVVTLVAARRAPRVTDAAVWGCGAVRDSPRTQYTATAFAEPLIRVFDDAVQPSRDLTVDHVAESRFMAAEVRYTQTVADVVEVRLWRPAVRVLDRLAAAARRVQNGSVQRYLAFAFVALLAVLGVVAR